MSKSKDTTMTCKTIVTFGTSHHHEFDNKEFGYENAALIRSKDEAQGRALASAYFGTAFCTTYHVDDLSSKWFKQFKNIVPVN